MAATDSILQPMTLMAYSALWVSLVVSVAFIFWGISKTSSRRRVSVVRIRKFAASNSLASVNYRQAICDALELNAYSPGDGNPTIHLESIIRIVPEDFESATNYIVSRFGDEQVISLDLRALGAAEAIRLVDFCSGMAAGARGWLSEIAGDVLIIAPRNCVRNSVES